ncbi:L-serine ammonia-lyase, iron-sulfur-dependent, subunit alpha [Geosporobacter ferrireducens]|uniref:L-serine ammonia-lyase, iron-sulfur-dependent, subunit alpha n=1 Tax=Geosporobacter ferrireducens TaxID=1424294 RepID=UPI00139D9D0B|nr:L-serine ammonia-lyase, iron-sulfur-dependent, subunit alpha [Geosporobacter ferrireducens]MTI57586.1 L-serine ammonia-lyase, iron-sulfur-dependent, subunit alpha [Geosporobacter ferrireducens]
MYKKPCSIFNEVFGPVMIGPSSSHTAGPARIGKVANMLLDDEVEEIEIIFDCNGSYAATYKAQGSNYGFIGGVLGIDVSDENIKQSLKTAEEKNVKVTFKIENIEGDIHPNFARMNLTGKSGKQISIETASTGGGMFEITKYDTFPLSLKGDCIDILVMAEKMEVLAEIKILLEKSNMDYEIRTEEDENKILIDIKLDREISHEILKQFKGLPGVLLVKYIKPVLPVVKKNLCSVPFMNAEEALEYSKTKSSTLWELACDYEEAISGKGRNEIIEMMIHIVRVMRASALKGIEGNFEKRGFLTSKAGIIDKNMRKENAKMVDMGMLNKVMVWATAVMEYDICRGKIVAAPTGGSCGVIPGAIVAVGDQMELSDEAIAKGLLASGMIGVFIDHQATFAAEVCGCQAENGAASSMAAAGVVQLLGGSVEEGFSSASLALQNILGLICDPVAGVGNIPCVSRNPMAAVNGILSANMVLNGFDPYIPLDETINAMMEVGRLMPREHRCTGLGGLCITKSAGRALEEFNANCSV